MCTCRKSWPERASDGQLDGARGQEAFAYQNR